MTQEIITQITDTVGTEVFGIWFLIGAAFVFFMQAGFAMVETGFTRAKNAGNIIMKNLMDFLYWNNRVYFPWIWIVTRGRCTWRTGRSSNTWNLYRLCKL